MNVIFCKHLTSFDTIEETVNLSKSRKLPFLETEGRPLYIYILTRS